MYGFYCIIFIEYMLGGKTLLDYTNLFSPNDYDYNDKIIHKFFNPNLSGWGVILLLPVGFPLITQKR